VDAGFPKRICAKPKIWGMIPKSGRRSRKLLKQQANSAPKAVAALAFSPLACARSRDPVMSAAARQFDNIKWP
jgi:hypothetical protein